MDNTPDENLGFNITKSSSDTETCSKGLEEVGVVITQKVIHTYD